MTLGFPDSSVGKESTCSAGDPCSTLGLERSAGEGKGYPIQFLGFPGGSAGKESACNVGDQGLIPGLGRSPGEGKGYLLQYSGLENSMGSIGLHGEVHGVTKSQTLLSDFHFYFHWCLGCNQRWSSMDWWLGIFCKIELPCRFWGKVQECW